MNNISIKGEKIEVAYGSNVLMRDVDFQVNKGDVFIIMGGSGCGKSSLMRVMTGLKQPSKGRVLVLGKDFYAQDGEKQKLIMRDCGILYQSGALFSSMIWLKMWLFRCKNILIIRQI